MAQARANHPETKFDKICRLARELNEVGLREIAAQDVHFARSTNTGGDTPLRLLAREGSDEAVWLLLSIHRFAEDAVMGYAETGQVEKITMLVNRKTYHDFPTFAEYSAYLEVAPYVGDVNKIVVEGYAYAGLHDKVEEIIREDGQYAHQALRGYLRAECWDKIKEYVDRGYEINPNNIPDAYFGESQKVARLLALVNNDQSRRAILQKRYDLEHHWQNPDKKRILADASLMRRAFLINRVMREFQLTYEQAVSWERMREQTKYVESVRIWLLQGMQIADRNNTEDPLIVLPVSLRDLYFHITTFVLGMSLADTKAVLAGVHANLFGDVMKNIAMKFADKKVPTRFFAEAAKASEQYERRIAKYNL